MHITIQQIYMELSRKTATLTNLPLDYRQMISHIQIISSPDEMKDPSILYLTLSDAMLRVMDGYYIQAPNIQDPIKITNLIQEIFSELHAIKHEMQKIAMQKQNYGELLQYAEEKLGLALLLVDKNLHYLAETPSFRRINYSWMGDFDDITIEWINFLEQDDAFMNAINHIEAFEYMLPDGNRQDRSYCYNVRVNGEYEARLLMQNQTQTGYYGGIDWVDDIGNLIAVIFANNYEQISQTSEAFRFYELIQKLATDLPINPEEASQILNESNWESNWRQGHRYQVYMFQPQQKENETINLRYYQTAINRLMKECCVFEINKKICCVRNITQTDLIYQDIRQQLSEFLRENLFYVGISNEFTDLLKLRYYFQEAREALRLGLQQNSTSWTYHYKDYVLSNLLEIAQKALPMVEWLHPALRILMEYDEREGTELVRTAFEYMKQQYNVTHTAKALFIHRTTLLFRLQRIQALTGLDWTNMEDRTLLSLNYIMWT